MRTCEWCDVELPDNEREKVAVREFEERKGRVPNAIDDAPMCEPCMMDYLRQVTLSAGNSADPRQKMAKEILASMQPEILQRVWAK